MNTGSNFQIPGAFWVALILGLVPIIQMYFGDYRITAGVVLFLELAAKLIQVYLVKEPGLPPNTGGPGPTSMAPKKSGKVKRILLG